MKNAPEKFRFAVKNYYNLKTIIRHLNKQMLFVPKKFTLNFFAENYDLNDSDFIFVKKINVVTKKN